MGAGHHAMSLLLASHQLGRGEPVAGGALLLLECAADDEAQGEEQHRGNQRQATLAKCQDVVVKKFL